MERLTYEKRPSSWNLGKYPTNYTSRHTFQEVVARLAAYEDTGLGPEEITTEPYGCVFYCNRKCSLDGDFCAEGPGCPWEIDAETAKHMLELAQAENDGRLVVRESPIPGDKVWVIEQDEYGEPIEIGGYMFFAFSGQAVIVSAFINDCETLDETVEYHIEETLRNYVTDLSMFCKNDCYATREEAEAALKKREEAHEREGV